MKVCSRGVGLNELLGAVFIGAPNLTAARIIYPFSKRKLETKLLRTRRARCLSYTGLANHTMK